MECPVCGKPMRLLPYKDVAKHKQYWKCDNCKYREEETYYDKRN